MQSLRVEVTELIGAQRTLSKSFPCSNGYESYVSPSLKLTTLTWEPCSNHFGVVQAMFRKQAPKLESSKLNTTAQIRWFLEQLPLKPDSVVLDMNCGTGIVRCGGD